MSTDESAQNPFTRPGFVAAALVVALLVVMGVVIAIINATRAESTPEPQPTPTVASSDPPTTTTPTEIPALASICGLNDDSSAKPPVSAPEALWQYQGTTAHPTSETYGPGKEDPAGFRYCFQHSPTGALFAAANAIAQGSDPTVSDQWVKYAIAKGAHREELLKSVGAGSQNDGTRLMVQGFRILEYDDTTAQVDLGVRASSGGETVVVSGVYQLVWEEGDWKISADVEEPLNTAAIPDLAGYIAWGE